MKKLKILNKEVPSFLKLKNFEIVPDQIQGKTFALSIKSDEHPEFYANKIVSNFMTYSECRAYLLGLYDMIAKFGVIDHLDSV